MPIRLEICESNLRSMAAIRFNNDASNCQVTEAIQSLPPELRDIIYKHYLAIKLRERAALGWDLLHDELSMQPFCHNRQQSVRIIMCLEYNSCHWEGLCYPCFEQGIKHKLLYTPPIENTPLVKICSDTYDWHSAYNDWQELREEE